MNEELYELFIESIKTYYEIEFEKDIYLNSNEKYRHIFYGDNKLVDRINIKTLIENEYELIGDLIYKYYNKLSKEDIDKIIEIEKELYRDISCKYIEEGKIKLNNLDEELHNDREIVIKAIRVNEDASIYTNLYLYDPSVALEILYKQSDINIRLHRGEKKGFYYKNMALYMNARNNYYETLIYLHTAFLEKLYKINCKTVCYDIHINDIEPKILISDIDKYLNKDLVNNLNNWFDKKESIYERLKNNIIIDTKELRQLIKEAFNLYEELQTEEEKLIKEK